MPYVHILAPMLYKLGAKGVQKSYYAPRYTKLVNHRQRKIALGTSYDTYSTKLRLRACNDMNVTQTTEKQKASKVWGVLE